MFYAWKPTSVPRYITGESVYGSVFPVRDPVSVNRSCDHASSSIRVTVLWLTSRPQRMLAQRQFLFPAIAMSSDSRREGSRRDGSPSIEVDCPVEPPRVSGRAARALLRLLRDAARGEERRAQSDAGVR